MADIIKVNTRTLKKDTDEIQEDLSKVNKEIQTMQENVRLMNNMWSGDANEAFNKAFSDDIKALSVICKSIESLIKYETTAKTEYDSCEQKVSSVISSISI